MKNNYIFQKPKFRTAALFYIFAKLFTIWPSIVENRWILISLLHSICYNITHHIASGKLHCILVKERK